MGHRFDSWSGTKIPHAHKATTELVCSRAHVPQLESPSAAAMKPAFSETCPLHLLSLQPQLESLCTAMKESFRCSEDPVSHN